MTLAVRSRVESLVASLDADVVAAVHADPISGLEEQFGLVVRRARRLASRGHGGLCDGVSFTGDDGVVLYVPSRGRRQNFTIVHELGHYLIETDTALLDWIQDQPDPNQTLEVACEAFAAAILVPRATVDGVVGTGPLRAGHVLELYDMTQASRHACLIALGRRLPCEGFLSTVAADDFVVFASTRTAETRLYAWKGDRVPDDHPIRDLRDGAERSSEVRWRTRGGRSGRRYYFNAYRADPWIYVVHAEANLWSSSPLSIEDAGTTSPKATRRPVQCRCGFVGATTDFPCTTCRQVFCPGCGACACTRAAARANVRCAGCTAMFPPHQIEDGLCTGCR